MIEQALQFCGNDKMGQVVAVDTTRVLIEVNDPEILTKATVGNLIAIKGRTESEFLIAITDKVTRSLKEGISDSIEDTTDEFTLELTPDDKMVGILIGTYKTVEGDKKDLFKRGADSFPQIDRSCYFIEGGNL
jgi:uncharacterized protein